MLNLVEVISTYVRETRRLESLPSSTETTFYPDLKLLLNAVLKSERLPFDVITGTLEGAPRRLRKRNWSHTTRALSLSKNGIRTARSGATNLGGPRKNNAVIASFTKNLVFASNCSTIPTFVLFGLPRNGLAKLPTTA